MKEKMRALLLQNPDITLPEAARALNANERNCKSVRVAYWQARALLMEELTGKTLRAILDEGHTVDTDRIGNEGHINSMGHMSRDLFEHSVSEEDDHTVSKERYDHGVSFNENTNTNVSSEDMDHVFGDFDISDY